MPKNILASMALSGLVLTGAAQAQEQRLPRECIREIVELCGRDRAQIRACLRDKASELSETCRAEFQERMQARRGQARGGDRATRQAPQTFDLVSYGAHERQGVDFYPASDPASRPPLVVFVHGGGWSVGNRTRTVQGKPAHFVGQGYAFASVGYRVLPDAPVEEQARDVARAIAKLRAQADSLGFDPDRIVLMGHSAGAHLAALVSTDPQFSSAADFAAIRGVVLLDGAGYDVVANMARPDLQMPGVYTRVFGSDQARQRALSPITHVGAPDASDWLILHVADRPQSRDQSEALAAALEAAGARAEVVAVEDTDHGRLNRELGTQGDRATATVDAFLDRLFD